MVAILLVTEMVGSVEQILPMTLITLVAYYVNRLLGVALHFMMQC